MELKQRYEDGRAQMGNDYDYYNLVEKVLIEVELSERDKQNSEKL